MTDNWKKRFFQALALVLWGEAIVCGSLVFKPILQPVWWCVGYLALAVMALAVSMKYRP